MSAKKILYITPAFPVGGAERFLQTLSGALAPFAGQQWIVSLSDRNALAPEIAPGIQFVPMPRKSKLDTQPLRQLRKLVKQERPDIIVCINFFSYFMMRCALAGMRNRPRTFISYHSTLQVTRKEHLQHFLYTHILTKKDRIVTVSQKQTEHTIRTYRIPRRKFDVVLNCVNTDYWQPDASGEVRRAIRQQMGIPENAPVIILSAALRIEKNHVGAVAALRLLHEKHNCKAYLLLVGDGVMRPAIEAAAQSSGISQYIKMAGMQRDVRPYYQAADMFTLVSDIAETFSIAALEAMSCGLPGTLTDLGGAAEMVTPGVNGFLCTPETEDIAQTWLKCMNAGFTPAAIHAYAYEHFRIEKMVTAYKKILELES